MMSQKIVEQLQQLLDANKSHANSYAFTYNDDIYVTLSTPSLTGDRDGSLYHVRAHAVRLGELPDKDNSVKKHIFQWVIPQQATHDLSRIPTTTPVAFEDTRYDYRVESRFVGMEIGLDIYGNMELFLVDDDILRIVYLLKAFYKPSGNPTVVAVDGLTGMTYAVLGQDMRVPNTVRRSSRKFVLTEDRQSLLVCAELKRRGLMRITQHEDTGLRVGVLDRDYMRDIGDWVDE